MPLKSFTISLLCFVAFDTVYAQEQVQFEHISVEQGLSHPQVNAILQDSRGFLWIGTLDGLNKYDGYTFTTYKHIPEDPTSISDHWIDDLYEDTSGRLWIGTQNGLNLFDYSSETFSHFKDDSQNSRIRTIYEDRSGALWVGTQESGLNRFDPAQQEFKAFKHEPENPASLSHNMVIAIHEDNNGNLWVGTLGGGLNLFDQKTETFSHISKNSRNSDGFAMDNILTIYEDSFGKLWIGTYGEGLYRVDSEDLAGTKSFDGYQPQFSRFLEGNGASVIKEDRYGTLWVGTFGSGLFKYDREKQTFENFRHDPQNPNALSDDYVQAILEDRSGNFWIGTYEGLNKRQIKSKNFSHYQFSALRPYASEEIEAWAINETKQTHLIIGTNNGVYQLDRSKNKITEIPLPIPSEKLSSINFQAVEVDRFGQIWLGTFGYGVYKFDPTSGNFETFSKKTNDSTSLKNNFVIAIREDRVGQIWIGTLGGLNKFNRESNNFVRLRYEPSDASKLRYNSFQTIYEDRRGQIWLGTFGGGLLKLDPKTHQFQHYTHNPKNPNSISHNIVTSIVEDRAGFLWLGTKSGLNRFDPQTGGVTRYFEDAGFAGSYYNGIVIDNDNNLWLITETQGIARVNIEDPKKLRIRNFDAKDGLQSNQFNLGAFYKSRDGELFFGNKKGLIRFDPAQIKENTYIAPIVLTAFKKFNEFAPLDSAISEKEELSLSYRDNFISFEFAALDYTVPKKNRYAYKMEGFDSDWIYTGNRRYASYTNLEPGDYIFRVKGSNNDGVWNEEGASVKIIIKPPFWQAWWVQILAFSAIAGLLVLTHKYRVSRLLEVERTRNRIAQDLHDNVGATLSSISYFAQAIESESDVEKEPVLKKFLTLIRESSSEAQEAISDIIWSIDPTNDRWEKVLAKFRRHASDLFESKSIQYDIEIPDSISVKKLDMERRRNLWLIFKEITTNIAKHSECSQATIKLSAEDKQIQLTVEDDGKGFDANGDTGRNGIKNIRARANLLKATVNLETTPGEGTCWELRFGV